MERDPAAALPRPWTEPVPTAPVEGIPGRPPPLRAVGEARSEGPWRPARLYEFVRRPGDERREFYRW